MKKYEVIVEKIIPCGGGSSGGKDFIDVETDSPEAYVKENGQYPIIDDLVNANGDMVITTGDGKGSFIKYTFLNS